MTREQILAMPAGPEMDELVATEITGDFSRGLAPGPPNIRFPPFSTDDHAASELLARITAGRARSADFGVYCDGECEATIGGARATAPSLALAICRAALLSKIQG